MHMINKEWGVQKKIWKKNCVCRLISIVSRWFVCIFCVLQECQTVLTILNSKQPANSSRRAAKSRTGSKLWKETAEGHALFVERLSQKITESGGAQKIVDVNNFYTFVLFISVSLARNVYLFCLFLSP